MKALLRPVSPNLAKTLGLALVLAAFLVWAWLNLQWAVMDQHPVPAEYDSFKYVLNSHEIAREILLSERPLDWKLLYVSWKKHPMLSWNVFSLLQSYAVAKMGPDRPAEIVALLPPLLLLVAGTVALGWVTLGPAEGILAGLILLCFPGVIGFSRVSHLEIPAMAVAAWLPVFAWRATEPGRLMSAAAFGFLAAAGLYFRYEFPVYAFPAVVAPAMIWLARVRSGGIEQNRKAMLGWILATPVIAAIAFALVFYSWRAQLSDQAVSMVLYGLNEGPTSVEYFIDPVFQGRQWLILPTELIRVTIEPLWALAALISMPLILVRGGKSRWPAVHVILVALAGLLFLNHWENKEARRLLLILPAVAVIIAGGFVNLRRWLGPAFSLGIALALILGAVRTFDLSFIPRPDAERVFLLEESIPQPPRDDDWELTRAASVLLRHGNRPLESSVAVVDSVKMQMIPIRMRTVFRGLDLHKVYRDPDAGPDTSPLFDPIAGYPDLILSPDDTPCGPVIRNEVFDYLDPSELDRRCSALPPYPIVDTIKDRDGTLLYLMKKSPSYTR